MENRFPATLARADGSCEQHASPRLASHSSALCCSREKGSGGGGGGGGGEDRSLYPQSNVPEKFPREVNSRDQVATAYYSLAFAGRISSHSSKSSLLFARVPAPANNDVLYRDSTKPRSSNSVTRVSLPLNFRCISNLKFWRRDEGISSDPFSLLHCKIFRERSWDSFRIRFWFRLETQKYVYKISKLMD